MKSPRSTEEQWELLLVTLELASHFELVFIACADQETIERVRARLRYDCNQRARKLLEADEGEDGLDWLTSLRGSAGEAKGPLPVLFYRVPTEPEKELFVLHRFNENRDNLRDKRRGVRGMLVLAGGPHLLRTAATEAPDLWSVRSKAFEVLELPLPKDLPSEFAPASPAPPPEPVIKESWRYDVFLSCAFRDRKVIEVLRDALRIEELRAAVDVNALAGGVGFEVGAAESEKYVFALSSDFIHEVWPKVEPLFEADPEGMRRRSIALLIRQCVPPAPLRTLKTLDWTTAGSRRGAYPQLWEFLRAPSVKRGANKRAKELVATETVIPEPPMTWWRRLRRVAAFLAFLAIVVMVSDVYEYVTAAKMIFPAFGLGTVCAEAADGRATMSPQLAWSTCSRNPDVAKLEVGDWKSGEAKLVMKKLFGSASIIHSIDRIDLKFQASIHPPPEPGQSPESFEVALVDAQGREARFVCERPTRMLALDHYLLKAESPDGMDLERIERIELRMWKTDRSFATVQLKGMAINDDNSDGHRCTLVSGKDGQGRK